MADIFVWSGASGANDGSAWEDAYILLASALDGTMTGFTPGTDFVYVRGTHAESNSVDVTLGVLNSLFASGDDPVRVLCVVGADTGTTPGNLTTGASLTTSTSADDLFIEGHAYFYGIDFIVGNEIWIGTSANSDQRQVYEQCSFEVASGSSADQIHIKGSTDSADVICVLIDVDIKFNQADQSIEIGNAQLLWDGGSVDSAGTNVTTLFDDLSAASRHLKAVVRNVDLSHLTNNLVDLADVTPQTNILFSRCLLGSGVTHFTGSLSDSGKAAVHHCQSGTDSDPSYQMHERTWGGDVEVDTARYRTGGASDGERTNPYSWSMDSTNAKNVIELYQHLLSPPIAGWTDGDASTSHTYRIYIASGATLQNDEVWVDLHGPNDAATDSMGKRNTSRPGLLDTPANLTSDGSSTWNGADVGTKQYIDVSYTPDKPGPITAYIYLAKPSERVSIDPKIYVDP